MPHDSFPEFGQAKTASRPSSDPVQSIIESAILRAVIYADLFDYALIADEVYRYLPGIRATPNAIQEALGNGKLLPQSLTNHRGYFTLPGRESNIETRQRRAIIAERMWPRATRYVWAIAQLPYVRMVAITGALARDNVEPDADIDFLIVTEPERLWLCRAFVIILVRLAEKRGDRLCPNYFISLRALERDERNLYTAHELTQMIPVFGLDTYKCMRRLNSWTAHFLPNASDLPRILPPMGLNNTTLPIRQKYLQSARRLAEFSLSTPVGGWLERWEMKRKIKKYSGQPQSLPGDKEIGGQIYHQETAFGVDWCKGHFDNHSQQTLEAYIKRLQSLDMPIPELIDPGPPCDHPNPSSSRNR